MTSFLLVPGACHGGWWYAPLVDRLAAAGHHAVALTLEGLDPSAAAPTDAITLDRHIDQVASALTENVVLVGHSYAGMPMTAAADAAPSRVRALVYLDALVPDDGDSCWTLVNDEERQWYIEGAARTGVAVDPMSFFDERARPHPLGTLLQSIKLTGAWRSVATKIYAVALNWPGESPLASSIEKVRNDPAFEVHDWDTRHNVMHDGPDRVFNLLQSMP